jgi:hypothetical protein
VDIEAAAASVTGNAGFSDDTADGDRARLHELFLSVIISTIVFLQCTMLAALKINIR